MLTAMTEEDWTIVLQVFDASQNASHSDARAAQNYASFVALALGFISIKSVHTT